MKSSNSKPQPAPARGALRKKRAGATDTESLRLEAERHWAVSDRKATRKRRRSKRA